MNQILVIHPYKSNGVWVFDDDRVGLVREPFVSGADDIIDFMVSGIPDAESGFNLLFSAEPFPGHHVEFERRHEEFGGYWYHVAKLDKSGWLCPALFLYFDEAPEQLYAQFKPRG